MRILVIDESAKAEIKRVKDYAEANRMTLAELYHRTLSAEVIGDDPNYQCFLVGGYKVIFSVEQQPELGWCYHLSVSLNDPLLLPNLCAVRMVMDEFGMSKPFKQCLVWVEERITPQAVNVIMPISLKPCSPDHNGECLVCDCLLSDCAWDRLFAGDFRYEGFDELMCLFARYLTGQQTQELIRKWGGEHEASRLE